MKICFLIARPDAFLKPGGDLVQVQSVASGMERFPDMEIEVSAWTENWSPANYDLVHIFNDRPQFLLNALILCSKHHTSVVVSPIHHSNAEMLRLRFNFSEGKAIRHLLARPRISKVVLGLYSNLADFRLARIYRGWKGVWGLVSTNWYILNTSKSIGRFLETVSLVQVLANGEKDSLRRDYGWRSTNFLVLPNGVDRIAQPEDDLFASRMNKLLVVGRIESRKRQLEISRAANSNSAPICFVGDRNPSRNEYFEEFLKAVSASKNQEYLGALPHEEVLELMRNCKVLFSASIAEVLSLVELEASIRGAYVVTGGAGYSREYLAESQLLIYDSTNIASGLRLGQKLLAKPRGPSIRYRGETWDSVASLLHDQYTRIMEAGLK